VSYAKDPRVVLTLDAGGTQFVFSAVQCDREVVPALALPSNGHDLTACLETTIEGFSRVRDEAPAAPVAISFAFPGPADYPRGIIGDLGNLPGFRGGVPLGPMLEERFGIPVFINNDGDLFAFGEAIAGLLPWVNDLLEQAGSPKRYRNLLGATLGTGFGGGIVRDGRLLLGDATRSTPDRTSRSR
jgi:glucokinase